MKKLKAIPKYERALLALDDALSPVRLSLARLAPIRISFGDRRLNGHCQIIGLNGGNFLRGCDNESRHTVNALPPGKNFLSIFSSAP